MIFTREKLTEWAALRGIDTALFEDEAEWELLDQIAELHFALRSEGDKPRG